jgi:hypothetical protein
MTKGGPVTKEGKEVIRWNATRHGIRSPAPVVPALEKIQHWEEHRSWVLESLSPEGHLEKVLAERVALLSWRLHRVTRYERESVALSQEKLEEDLGKKWHSSFGFGSPSGPAHKMYARLTSLPGILSVSSRGCPNSPTTSDSLPKMQTLSSGQCGAKWTKRWN